MPPELINMTQEELTKQCVVAAYGPNGDPDFYFVKVTCTKKQYESEHHLVTAARKALREGYAPWVLYDDASSAGRALLPLFHWETASVICCEDIPDSGSK